MPNGSKSPALLLCAGKDCYAKRKSAFKQLRSAATDAGLRVETVTCQGSCAGPTAVVSINGDLRWFEKLQTNRARRDLIELAAGEAERPSRQLADRELTGKRRAKAKKKLKSA